MWTLDEAIEYNNEINKILLINRLRSAIEDATGSGHHSKDFTLDQLKRAYIALGLGKEGNNAYIVSFTKHGYMIDPNKDILDLNKGDE